MLNLLEELILLVFSMDRKENLGGFSCLFKLFYQKKEVANFGNLLCEK